MMKSKMMTNETTAKMDIINTTELFVNKILFGSRTTIISANRLLKKWANIATKILSVLRYNIAMQIPKMNAENIDPKL